ncbi:MAG: hypothetical protein J5659_00060 [Clostridia bacterium]|nr:hypothetical protein [Clostridia bacterium]
MIKGFFKKRYFLPPFLVLATNLTVSFLTRPFIDAAATCLVTTVDRKIPFVPEFIYIYVFAFVQWLICILAVMIKDKEKSFYYCGGIIFGNLMSGIVFLVFPTIMSIRPEYTGGGLTGEIVRFIFAADTPPMNIFPSIHCLFSWGCMRMICALGSVPKALKVFNAVFSVLVFLSVLFVKQHVVYDIPAGIFAFEAGLFLTRKLFLRVKV